MRFLTRTIKASVNVEQRLTTAQLLLIDQVNPLA